MSMLRNSHRLPEFTAWYQRFFERIFPRKLLSTPLETWNVTPNVISTVLLASLLINILSLAFPITLLQAYDRIIPNKSVNTLVLLTLGVGIALILEALLRIE